MSHRHSARSFHSSYAKDTEDKHANSKDVGGTTIHFAGGKEPVKCNPLHSACRNCEKEMTVRIHRLGIAVILAAVCALTVLPLSSFGQNTTPTPSTWGSIKAMYGVNDKSGIQATYPNYCFQINVPWMSQLPPGTDWSKTNNCGQACCAMIGAYYNHSSTGSWVIDSENDWLRCPKPYGCTTGATTLQNLLSGYHGLRSNYYVGNLADDVVEEGANGRPVIVGVRTRMQLSGRSHWMVFVGWSGPGGPMYFNDPGRSQSKDGAFVRYSVSEFTACWNAEGRKYIPVYK